MVKLNKNHSENQQAHSGSSTEGSESQDIPAREHTFSEEDGSNDEIDGFDAEIDYGTPIRSRIRFTTEQTQMLEEIYQKNKRPTSEAKQKLSHKFGTNIHRIQIWFQNRRAKEKKTTSGSSGSSKVADGEASTSENEKTAATSTSKKSSSHPTLPNENSYRGKRRKVSEEYVPHYPVQLRSDSSSQQHNSQPTLIPTTFSFYQDTRCNTPAGCESADFHQVMPGIPTVRRVGQGFSYPSTFGKLYHNISSPTMNPQDMIYRHPSPGYLQESYTHSKEGELNLDHTEYYMDDTNLGPMVNMSSDSRQLQHQKSNTGQQPSILTHEDEEQRVKKENVGSKKGEYFALKVL